MLQDARHARRLRRQVRRVRECTPKTSRRVSYSLGPTTCTHAICSRILIPDVVPAPPASGMLGLDSVPTLARRREGLRRAAQTRKDCSHCSCCSAYCPTYTTPQYDTHARPFLCSTHASFWKSCGPPPIFHGRVESSRTRSRSCIGASSQVLA